jgi:glycosyltransferase involved in cell wall biosynthesis
MLLAASGSPIDHRAPGYFQELSARIDALGIGADFRILGLVPFTHVIQLALQSVAVVNPSLFEGWSTTVEEAKSLGVPLVLSNINVHREQTGNSARLFDPLSPVSAESALRDAWHAQPLEPVARLRSSAELANERVREFAARLAEAFESAAALSRTKS